MSLLCFISLSGFTQHASDPTRARAPVTRSASIELATDCAPAGHGTTSMMAHRWGATLLNAAYAATNDRAGHALRELAKKCYAQAIKLHPTNAQVLDGLAGITSLEAKFLAETDLPAARKLWREAGNTFNLAMQREPADAEIPYNWAIALGDEAQALARLAPSQLAVIRRLWQSARKNYAIALKLSPNNSQIADNWGSAFAVEAKVIASSDLPAAQRLWSQAYERYTYALQRDPAHLIANYNMATAMLHERAALLMSAQKISAQSTIYATDLEQRATGILLSEASRSDPQAFYHIACFHAIQGNSIEAVDWLQRSANADRLPSKSQLVIDFDLDNIRQTPEFAKWFSQIR